MSKINDPMNIAIVDDHLLFAELLQSNLSRSFKGSDIRVFSNPTNFLSSDFNQWKPEVLICDLMMPDIDGMTVMREINKILGKSCKIMIMSGITDEATVKRAMAKGALGYVAKDVSVKEMVSAIRAVREGNKYLSKELNDHFLGQIFGEDQISFHLAPKENEVLQRFCSGSKPKEIAEEMNISIHTVNQYSKMIMKKFKVNRTTDMVLFAIRKGLCIPRLPASKALS